MFLATKSSNDATLILLILFHTTTFLTRITNSTLLLVSGDVSHKSISHISCEDCKLLSGDKDTLLNLSILRNIGSIMIVKIEMVSHIIKHIVFYFTI